MDRGALASLARHYSVPVEAADRNRELKRLLGVDVGMRVRVQRWMRHGGMAGVAASCLQSCRANHVTTVAHCVSRGLSFYMVSVSPAAQEESRKDTLADKIGWGIALPPRPR